MYAHLGVTGFWWRQRQLLAEPAGIHRANVEFARWRDACAEVADTVSGRQELTRCGTIFVDGMIRELCRWQDERVPPTARAEARRIADEHRSRWATANQERGSGT
jgi:uncharacterized protein